jgi:hypothetical protein
MPPKTKAGAEPQEPTPPITEHDPKVLVEKDDLEDRPVKTSGAVPVEVPAADTAPLAVGTLVETAEYGKVSVADLKEILRAELAAEAAAKQAEEDAKLPELCPSCFLEGWESKNAAGQDGVGCEHGSWNRTRAKE